MYEKDFVGGGAHPIERRTVAKEIHVRKILRVQCGEGGAARKKCGPTAYRATSGRLTKNGGLKSDGIGGKGVEQDGHGG